jgi:phosphomannomutase
MGAMMCHFVCDQLARTKKMPKAPFVLTTLVSTKMVRVIGEDYGVRVVDDLPVGFKWMAELLHQYELSGQDTNDFIFGFEESIGYVRGDFVRDKDSAAGAVTAAQLCAWCKSKKMSLLDYLDRLYEKYGAFKELQFSKFLRGSAGSVMMGRLMDALRNTPPAKIGTFKVHSVIDRLEGKRTNMTTGESTAVLGTPCNVLIFELDAKGLTSVAIRPSGTEPKIKHYMAAFKAPGKDLLRTKKSVDSLIAKMKKATEALEDQILSTL